MLQFNSVDHNMNMMQTKNTKSSEFIQGYIITVNFENIFQTSVEIYLL